MFLEEFCYAFIATSPKYGVGELVQEEVLVMVTPNSCAFCGKDQKNHGLSYNRVFGNHQYVMPSDSLRLVRMKARANQ